MRYDIDKYSPSEDIFYNIPELRDIKSFKDYPGSRAGELNRDHVIRYIILLYSEDSILNKRPMPPLKERKTQAATIAGFPKKGPKKEFVVAVKRKLFELDSERIVAMIFDYLIAQKNWTWNEICTIEQMLEEYTKIRLAPIKEDAEKGFDIQAAKRKSDLTKDSEEMLKKLESYYKDFFKNHEDDSEKLKRVRVRIEDLARPAF